MRTPWTILSLGGALIVPDELDVPYLKKFRALLHSFRDRRFVVACGGGRTSRKYLAAAKKLVQPNAEDQDWIGIRALSLNAELVRVIFGESAHPFVPRDPHELKTLGTRKVIVASAREPGRSSDFDAVLWAERCGASRLINLTNIDHVYSADPRKDKSAKAFGDISWKEYRKIVGTTWRPQSNSPFDPIASTRAAKLGLSVAVLDGRNISNVRQAILGKKFVGTLIHP